MGHTCELHKNNRYFFIQNRRQIALYDIEKLKHVKNFLIPSKKRMDSISSASFSSDGKYINTFEKKQIKDGYSRPMLYRYHIENENREELKALPRLDRFYTVKNDKMYSFESITNRNKIFVYDILSHIESEGTQKDNNILSSIRGWWDCKDKLKSTKICVIKNNIKYSLATGSLIRTDLNSISKEKEEITFIQSRPLEKDYFYELGYKMPYLITKKTQEYRGWDISKGKQTWSIQQKRTVSAEFDSVPSYGLEFLLNEDRAIVIGGFEEKIYDINTKTGVFTFFPKFKNITSYQNLFLDKDNKVVKLTAMKQEKPYPIVAHYIDIKTKKVLKSFEEKTL